jgi:hypothetical protein
MATITTREVGTSNVGRPLTNSEIDNNFLGLNSDITTILNTISSGTTNVPKITGIVVTDSSYAVLDDTAVTTSGGYIKITGTGFTNGSQVLVGTVAASSVSFVSSTELRAQVPATAAGTYVVYVVATDGSVAIRVNGITFSATPTWTTSSILGTSGITINIQLAAVSDTTITYSLAAGSTLPTGLSLSSSGLLSGTVTEPTVDTTYNFTINAVDLENQDSPRTFSITITVKDPYFSYVSLLLNTGSTNSQQNNTFLDSSTNNFTIARNGTPTQGSITPYWPVGQWSNYLNGSSYFQLSPNTAFAPGTGDFTVECWIYVVAHNVAQGNWIYSQSASGHNYFVLNFGPTGVGFTAASSGAGTGIGNSTAINTNTWYHIAVTRLSGIVRVFVNGVSGTPTSNTTDLTNVSYTPTIGSYSHAVYGLWNGYISNFRYVKGTAVYTTAFTPPTTPLTAITNTSLLTCQSNRFRDNSTNNFTLALGGTPTVQAFQPFSPTASYTTALYGGSGYFNGSTDYITYNQTFALGTNSFTLEFWMYVPVNPVWPTNYWLWGWRNGTDNCPAMYLNAVSGGGNNLLFVGGATAFLSNPSSIPTNSWTHIAIVRSGLGANNLKMYVNGVQVAQSSSTQSFTYTGTQPVGANASGSGSLYPSNVYFSNFRIVNGTAVYTGAFTPPTSPLTAITNTALLLNFTNAGIYDAAAQNVITTVGDAQVSTAITAKWPPTSIRFDGTGDYLSVSSGSPQSLTFGTGDFTIEFWVYFTSNTGQQCLYDGRAAPGSYPLLYTNAGVITYYVGGSPVITSIQPSTGVWYFMSLIRSSGITRFFINGAQSGGSYTDSTNYLAPPTSGARVGANYTGGDFLFGYMQDFRVTKIARAVTPIPTAAFQTR